MIELILISDEWVDNSSYDYDERIRTYKCPCGKNRVVWSKETPNGNGTGYQATYSDIFCYCEDCKEKYDFNFSKGYAKLK